MAAETNIPIMPRVFTVFAVVVPLLAVFLVFRTFDVTARIAASFPLALHPDTPGEDPQVYIAPETAATAKVPDLGSVGGAAEEAVVEGRFRRKIVAVGDLHGDLPNAHRVLHMANVVDESGHWSGGVDFFVQTGDIIDRYVFVVMRRIALTLDAFMLEEMILLSFMTGWTSFETKHRRRADM